MLSFNMNAFISFSFRELITLLTFIQFIWIKIIFPIIIIIIIVIMLESPNWFFYRFLTSLLLKLLIKHTDFINANISRILNWEFASIQLIFILIIILMAFWALLLNKSICLDYLLFFRSFIKKSILHCRRKQYFAIRIYFSCCFFYFTNHCSL